MSWDDFFAQRTDEEVGQVWARAMRELRNRDLIRSWNNPVADFAERLAAKELGLTLAPPVAQGYDATDTAGVRYQIKSRRLTPENKSRQLGVIRARRKERRADLGRLLGEGAIGLAEPVMVEVQQRAGGEQHQDQAREQRGPDGEFPPDRQRVHACAASR